MSIAVSSAAIVEAAIELIAPIPEESEARCDALDTAFEEDHEQLEGLDSKFYDYADDVTALLFAFVAQNPNEFGDVPS